MAATAPATARRRVEEAVEVIPSEELEVGDLIDVAAGEELAADGYNLYEGDVGTWYSHGGLLGNVCGAAVADLGSGWMRHDLVASSAADLYYLVTAFNTAGEGTAGRPARDAQCTCPP